MHEPHAVRPIPARPTLATAALLGLAFAAASCLHSTAARGLEPVWVDAEGEFTVGTTTRTDVLERLGAPSQILSLGNGTALYYLQERLAATGAFLLVYNTRSETLRYDRAVFFFDEVGVLTDFAVSAAEE